MPPASLSTLAVMKPGPTTARTRAARVRQLLNNVMTPSAMVPQHRNHVVRRDDAGEAAGRGVLAELEELRHLLTLRGLHLLKDFAGLIFPQVAEQVGRGVGIHLLDDVGGAILVERLDDRDLDIGIELFERLGGDLL